MITRLIALFQPAPSRQVAFIPLCRLRPDVAATWYRCPSMDLTDMAYERLYEFLQANLEGRWSLMPQDRNRLERYDVLLEIETEAGLLDLFRTTMGLLADEVVAA